MDNNELSGKEILVILVLIIIIAFAYFTWPMCLAFFVSIIGWRLLRDNQSVVGVTLRNFLLPVSLGLGLLCVAWVVLLFIKNWFDYQSIVAIESTLVNIRMFVRGWTSISYTKVVSILLLLIFLCLLFPKLKPISHYAYVNKVLSFVLILLITVTSFSFCAQFPLETLAENAHKDLVNKYKMTLRRQNEANAEILAANFLSNSIKKMKLEEKKLYLSLFYEMKMDDEADRLKMLVNVKTQIKESPLELNLPKAMGLPVKKRHKVTPEKIARELATRHSDKIESVLYENMSIYSEDSYKAEELLKVEKSPMSLAEWKKLNMQLEKEEANSKRTSKRARQMTWGVKEIFCESIGLGISDIEGLGGLFIENLVTEYAERYFEKHIKQIVHKDIAQIKNKIGEIFKPGRNLRSLANIYMGELVDKLSNRVFNKMADYGNSEIKKGKASNNWKFQDVTNIQEFVSAKEMFDMSLVFEKQEKKYKNLKTMTYYAENKVGEIRSGLFKNLDPGVNMLRRFPTYEINKIRLEKIRTPIIRIRARGK